MTDWYIDNLAAGANNGTSWADAWKGFAALSDSEKTKIRPGDTIYISGGPISKTYFERLNLRNLNGMGDAWITVTVGANAPDPSGHDGLVIIDGNGTINQLILCTGATSFLRIEGWDKSGKYCLQCQNGAATSGAVLVTCYNGKYVDLNHLKVLNDKQVGINLFHVNNYAVRGCYITCGVHDYEAQPIGIFVGDYGGYFSENILIEDNDIILGNTALTGDLHSDCLQFENARNIIVRNNLLAWVYGTGNNRGDVCIMSKYTYGDYYFYNNVCIGCSQDEENNSHFMGHRNGKLYIQNNTFVAQNQAVGRNLHLENMPDENIGAIQNNIFICGSGGAICTEDAINPAKYDYNCIWNENPDCISYFNYIPRSWEEHQAAGFDVHGIHANPQLNTVFYPASNSPCIQAGIDLSAFYPFDHDRNPRPKGSPWTMGAFEYLPADDELDMLKEQVDDHEVRLERLEALLERIEAAFAG